MTSKRTAEILKRYGFAFDESVTFQDPTWKDWHGTIDPIGNVSIIDDCRGIVVSGRTRTELDDKAIEAAKFYTELLRPCADLECDFHSEVDNVPQD